MSEIGKEYGCALFMLAAEKGKERDYMQSLALVKDSVGEDGEYLSFLASPAIALPSRLAALEEAFADKVETEVLSFLQLLCEKGRVFCFDEACDEYARLLEEHEQTAHALVTSVLALDDAQKRALTAKLEAYCKKKVSLTCKIDPTLLGGVTVELDGRVLDGSLRHRLNDIKDVMLR